VPQARVAIEELRPGLWTWAALHPSWTPDDGGPEGWEQEVRSYALDAGDSLVLFDPLVAAADVDELAAGRPVVVVLTCHWHRRCSVELAEKLGAVVHAPTAKVRDIGLAARPYVLGDDLPGDVEPHPAGYPDEFTLWIRGHGALVSGDVFLGGERGFRVQPDSWLAEGLTPEGLREQLRPLAELPVELLLPTHGDPVVDGALDTLRAALER
jgi:glyoxylase-like metal-dependent hydrolase (beta-lactamase superfamily II)